MTVNLEFTVEEATAYAEALNRALDNPFIQDDEECSNLWTLLGNIEGALTAETAPLN